ncbi:hypothetical protein [Microbacterium sp. A93]|uniref:hypothetical protein n=1 Tax=Microbacterium sp. A93 TaxID=3450716 RepID=UPI003F4415EB
MTADRQPDALQFIGSRTIWSAARDAHAHRLQHAPDAEASPEVWCGGGLYWLPFADGVRGVLVPQHFGGGGPSIIRTSEMADRLEAMRVAPLPDEFA